MKHFCFWSHNQSVQCCVCQSRVFEILDGMTRCFRFSFAVRTSVLCFVSRLLHCCTEVCKRLLRVDGVFVFQSCLFQTCLITEVSNLETLWYLRIFVLWENIAELDSKRHPLVLSLNSGYLVSLACVLHGKNIRQLQPL